MVANGVPVSIEAIARVADALVLTARTEPGARLVALAEALAAEIAPLAAAHDRDGSYPHASADRLAAAGYYAAPIPVRLGGIGADSLHDVVVASSRLARADASLAIGVNMHMAALLNMVRMYRAGAEKLAPALERIARDGVRLAAAVSEPGQDLTRPGTVATRTPRGWRIDGRKLFCTGSPAATVLYTSVLFVGRGRRGALRLRDGAGRRRRRHRARRLGRARHARLRQPLRHLRRRGAPRSRPARRLPRRRRRRLHVPQPECRPLPRRRFPRHRRGGAGPGTPCRSPPRRRPLAGARRGERDGPVGGARRALPGRAARRRAAAMARLAALFAEAQAAKTFTNDAAFRVVDRALALVGGAGYRSGHPLARAYRDVRAGAFMHPLGANRAYDLVGRVALGADPAIH